MYICMYEHLCVHLEVLWAYVHITIYKFVGGNINRSSNGNSSMKRKDYYPSFSGARITIKKEGLFLKRKDYY